MGSAPIDQRYPGQTVAERSFYILVRSLAALAYTLLYRFRVFHADRVPETGACLVACNHASHLDPPAVSSAIRRRATHFVAKAELFEPRGFGWLITALCSIPVRQDGESDISAIRAVLSRLQTGAAVLIFPEGSRTLTGQMQPLQRGVAVLVKRAGCPVVPCAVVGTRGAWPARTALPRFWRRRVMVAFGEPIPGEELLAGGPDSALSRLRREIESLRLELEQKLDADGRARAGVV